jgi:hypothetical protein
VTDILEITNPDSIVIDPDEMDVVEIGYVSGGFIPVPGPQGDKGDQGEPGPPGEILEDEIQIASPSLSWTTTHTLGRHPIVVTVDPSGNEILGDVHTTTTNVTVDWAVPIAGTLRLY